MTSLLKLAVIIILFKCSIRNKENYLYDYSKGSIDFKKEISSTAKFISANKVVKNDLENGDEYILTGQTYRGIFTGILDESGNFVEKKFLTKSNYKRIYPIDTKIHIQSESIFYSGYGQFLSSQLHMFVIKLNKYLEFEWAKSYKNIKETLGSYFTSFENDKIRLWGSVFCPSSSRYEITYIDLNVTNGNIINSRALLVDQEQSAKQVVEVDDFFLISGISIDKNKKSEKIFLTKIDKGTEIPYFFNVFTANKKILINKIDYYLDSYFLFGETECCNSVKKDGIVLKFNSNGNLLKGITIGGSGDDIIFDIQKNNKGFTLVLGTDSFDFPKRGILVEDIDFNLNHIYGRRYNNNSKEEQIFSIVGYEDYIIGVGRSEQNLLLVKTKQSDQLTCPFQDNLEPRIQDVTSKIIGEASLLWDTFTDVNIIENELNFEDIPIIFTEEIISCSASNSSTFTSSYYNNTENTGSEIRKGYKESMLHLTIFISGLILICFFLTICCYKIFNSCLSESKSQKEESEEYFAEISESSINSDDDDEENGFLIQEKNKNRKTGSLNNEDTNSESSKSTNQSSNNSKSSTAAVNENIGANTKIINLDKNESISAKNKQLEESSDPSSNKSGQNNSNENSTPSIIEG